MSKQRHGIIDRFPLSDLICDNDTAALEMLEHVCWRERRCPLCWFGMRWHTTNTERREYLCAGCHHEFSVSYNSVIGTQGFDIVLWFNAVTLIAMDCGNAVVSISEALNLPYDAAERLYECCLNAIEADDECCLPLFDYVAEVMRMSPAALAAWRGREVPWVGRFRHPITFTPLSAFEPWPEEPEPPHSQSSSAR